MSFFERIVYFLDAEMTTPASYGSFHLIAVLLTFLTAVFLVLKFGNADDKTIRRVVLFFWIVIVVLEIYKQVDFTFNYNEGDPIWDYEWYAFPFQFCSTPIYVLPFIVFLRDGKVRDSFISFMCYFSLIAGIAVMIYPEDVFIPTIGINIQTMFHHGSQVALGIFFAFYKRKKINRKFLASAIPVLLVFIGIALALNVGVHSWLLSQGNDETFNMFYLSPYYDSTLPVFSIISPLVPYPIFLFTYILAMLLGGMIILCVQKAFIYFACKLEKLWIDKVITIPAICFFIIEAALGFFIQFSSASLERILCFSSVALALLFALFTFKKNTCGALTFLGLVFTVCADVILVLIPEGNKLIAMCFFSLVQIFYFIRVFIENSNARTRKNHIIFRIELLFIALILPLAVLGSDTDALSIVSMMYFANLITNTVFAFCNAKRAPSFAIGLLLFAFCDVFVGLSMIDAYVSISETSFVYAITHTDINLIWAFYVPAQMLISLSSRTAGK